MAREDSDNRLENAPPGLLTVTFRVVNGPRAAAHNEPSGGCSAGTRVRPPIATSPGHRPPASSLVMLSLQLENYGWLSADATHGGWPRGRGPVAGPA